MLILLLALFVPSLAGAAELTLTGKATQGGLLIGQTEPGASVVFEGRRMRVTEDGRFLIGFGRDAGPASAVEVTLRSGAVIRREITVTPREFDIQRIDGLPEKMVTPPAAVLARIKADNEEVRRVRETDLAEPLFSSGFVWPSIGRISGVYGSQRILNGQPRQPHYGIDIAAPTGSPVVAPADGVVTMAHPDMYFTGATIILDHGHGLSSTFLHLDTIQVKPGDRLRQGQPIGTLGASGRATGPHLDWRINLFDIRIDPALLVGPMP
ncbi:MAG: M23 family metallopeptidase [Alphaproteobacteria bacterium]|nr:M23 family metallopeptidase [Alphaproteobacteria bacterium]MBU0795884.1 M23 family metallopeptidase [Alphaproteobacteria bacterium]MBU0888580.1 M23 family metallopeptidase [Alphaproteobacteria bacterium]MBU1813686.1 M23 family metallopeptidase [Alphaproteobacteria bacterium]MBU2090089.1 M23 family metallopeptidase [Alphaproteobacteria bacterium]